MLSIHRVIPHSVGRSVGRRGPGAQGEGAAVVPTPMFITLSVVIVLANESFAGAVFLHLR